MGNVGAMKKDGFPLMVLRGAGQLRGTEAILLSRYLKFTGGVAEDEAEVVGISLVTRD